MARLAPPPAGSARRTSPKEPSPRWSSTTPARGGNRRFGCVSALRAHTKAPYEMDLHRKTLRNAKGAYPPRAGPGSRGERARRRTSSGPRTAAPAQPPRPRPPPPAGSSGGPPGSPPRPLRPPGPLRPPRSSRASRPPPPPPLGVIRHLVYRVLA
jgi:hypothetical protein